jgi:hypothetical protein
MSYAKRLDAAGRRAAKASKAFERLEGEYLAAAQEQREVYDELTVELEMIEKLRETAFNAGLANEARAQRVRETFL